MDISESLQQQVRDALEARRPLLIMGSGSKHFYGNECSAKQVLSTARHVGVMAYEPTELFIKARSGTPLEQIESMLAEQGQMLAFEPPRFSPVSTIGGVIAAGLAGPARPWWGGVRDHMLGTTMITGFGEVASFGGQTAKNAAGYDVPRLMVGALGTLGVMLDVTLKVVTKPEYSLTTALEMPLNEALDYVLALRRSAPPLSGCCYFDDCLYIRFSATERQVKETHSGIGGEEVPDADEFWQSLRNQTHEFFQQYDRPLWRLSVEPTTQVASRLEGNALLDWAGAQRWVYSNMPVNLMRNIASKQGGQATLYRGRLPGVGAFQPQADAAVQAQRRVKAALDPQYIFNPGRLYADW
ncbi:glycolate oxidase subunit GlcE [Thiofilum flexile]|uniref:glycolate oxidase subunit GlcE n=1 Tax=Thiofilum flexile TaxID=125627 RepID=UPI00036C9C40|nr:glycolate oxidase subunit GlcE [Thiofilum flexile]